MLRAKNSKILIKKFFESNDFEIDENFLPEDLLQQLDTLKLQSNCQTEQQIHSMINLVKNMVVLGHKMIASIQRNSYSFQRKDKETLKGQILIEVDFKQKISIGISPRQINKEYYSQELR